MTALADAVIFAGILIRELLRRKHDPRHDVEPFAERERRIRDELGEFNVEEERSETW